MSTKDIVIETTRAIYQCCRYNDGLLRDVYSRILSTLQNELDEVIGRTSLDSDWPDGSMWRQVLPIYRGRGLYLTCYLGRVHGGLGVVRQTV